MIFTWCMIPYFILGILIELLYTVISYESANLIFEITHIDEMKNPTYFHSIELFLLFILNMATAIGENYFWPNALPPLNANSNLALRMAKVEEILININLNLERINAKLFPNEPQPVSYFLKNTNSALHRKKRKLQIIDINSIEISSNKKLN